MITITIIIVIIIIWCVKESCMCLRERCIYVSMGVHVPQHACELRGQLLGIGYLVPPCFEAGCLLFLLVCVLQDSWTTTFQGIILSLPPISP